MIETPSEIAISSLEKGTLPQPGFWFFPRPLLDILSAALTGVLLGLAFLYPECAPWVGWL